MRILFPISLILISIILFFLVVDPLYGDVKQLRSDVSVYNKALDNATNLQKTRDALLEKYRNIKQEDKDRLAKFIPNTVNNINFILEIEQIANIHSMPLKNIKFDDKQLPENQEVENLEADNTLLSIDSEDNLPYGAFPIEFVTEGRYDSFLSFLKDLEVNLRLMDIKEVSFLVPQVMEKTETGYDPNIYSYTLKVDTYWLK
ncbi:MAG: hypothetical protein PHT84_03030 [Candidatus Pacebacteria bacterium]|nr:hypothetical protein [Candidatus Paceibacterota bacterium]